VSRTLRCYPSMVFRTIRRPCTGILHIWPRAGESNSVHHFWCCFVSSEVAYRLPRSRILVRVRGVEPPCLAALVSRTSVYPCSTIPGHTWCRHNDSNVGSPHGATRLQRAAFVHSAIPAKLGAGCGDRAHKTCGLGTRCLRCINPANKKGHSLFERPWVFPMSYVLRITPRRSR
jgi:hypothetical protein